MAVLNGRRFHAWTAVLGAAFLACSAVSGLFWGASSYTYWKGGDYKKKKSPAAAPALTEAKVDARRAASAAALEEPPASLTLKAEGGRLVWEASAGKKSVLVDAVTGRKLSPLDEGLASAIADEYAPKGARRLSAVRQAGFVGKDGKKKGPAWVVSYDANGGTQIALDERNGAILEEFDPSRRFHFWVQRLHKLQFFGTDKELTAISGLFLTALLASGLPLWRKRR